MAGVDTLSAGTCSEPFKKSKKSESGRNEAVQEKSRSSVSRKTINKTERVLKENLRSASNPSELSTTSERQSCLQIFPGADDKRLKEEQSSTNDRCHSAGGSARRAPPIRRVDSAPLARNSLTKQVTLQAVRRKDDAFTTMSSSLGTARHDSSNTLETGALHKNTLATGALSKINTLDSFAALGTSLSDDDIKATTATATRSNASHAGTTNSSNGKDLVQTNGSVRCDEDDDDDDEDDDDSSSSDTEPRKAPNELLLEFLGYVMAHDYANAQKLCQLILIYEPTNAEALSFQSAIEEKIFYVVIYVYLDEDELNAASTNQSSTNNEEEEEDDSDDDDDSSDASSDNIDDDGRITEEDDDDDESKKPKDESRNGSGRGEPTKDKHK